MQESIRKLKPDDAAAFFDLRLQGLQQYPLAFGESPHEWEARGLAGARQFLESLQEPDNDSFILAAWNAEELLGVAAMKRHTGAKFRHKAEVWGMFVLPAHHGRGLGGRLLDKLIEEARTLPGLQRLGLCCMEDNSAAEALYRSRGFVEFGREPQALMLDGKYHVEIFMSKAL